MRRLRTLFAVVIAFALVAAACGDDTGGTTTTGAPGTTAAPTTTTEGDVGMDPRADWPDSLIFGFVPSREAEELQDNVDVLAGVLADALDIDVSGIVTSDYTALGVALGTGEAQIGAFAPANYVLASRIYPNIELLAQSVRFGSATYHAQYFTNDPSLCGADTPPVEGAYGYDGFGNVRALGPTDTPALQVGWNGDGTRDESVSAGLICPSPVDLSVVAGGNMAFGTETSTSGYIFPVLELRAAGLEQDVDYESFYSGSHDNSVLAVYNGDADFGVSFDDARRNVRAAHPDVGEKVIVFNISAPISNDVIAVDANLPDSLKDAIFQAIVDFIGTEEGREVMDKIYSWTDVIRADDRTRASFVLIEAAIDQLGFGQ
ncbi:MAG TPA: PhnD/SsuA/transferrin family substrate-binding protein [Acidimicrobiia bacterium]|nr:PhnD/SsuA/transferrin family substrate-binding protein [Acidimicrobiia bacterium]